jgi:tetratricopeptide (TPR) repeat protein
MKKRLVLLLVLLTLLAAAAEASVRSKMLYSRGVLQLNAGNTQAALDLFREAVEADPNDGFALYYRGVTRGQLGDSDGAIADLSEALRVQPTLTRAALELGIALVQKEEYSDAIPFLERARETEELEARASFFLGICRLRRGEYDRSRALFERAAALDPKLAPSSRYYEGIIAYREGEREEAIEHFQAVVDGAPDTQIAGEAKQLSDALQRTARPWSLYASTGLQYDSNVLLAGNFNLGSADDPEFVSGEGDGRAVFNLGGDYRLVDREWVALSVGYDFFQSLHFGLSNTKEIKSDGTVNTTSCCTNFNVQNHGAILDLSFTSEYADAGLLGRHDFALKETDKFLQSGTVLPWVAVPHTDWVETQLSFRLLINDFYGGDNEGEDYDVRDAYNYAGAIREVFDLGAARYVWLGYRYDQEDPVGNDNGSQSFAYDGHQIETGFSMTLPSAYGIEAGYAYRHESYDEASEIPPPPLPPQPERPRRSDNVHGVYVLLHIPLPSYFELTTGVFSTFNNSNQSEFEYDRLVGTIGITARL